MAHAGRNKGRGPLQNDTCECGDHVNGCENCTCRDCGEMLTVSESDTCNACIEKKELEDEEA